MNDVFNLLDIQKSIRQDYTSYVTNFINIKDNLIKDVVEKNVEEGTLWAEPLIQLNPAFKIGSIGLFWLLGTIEINTNKWN